MAELTAKQLAWLRSEVGEAATDEDLQARYDRLGSVRDVAIEVIRVRRAQLLDQPLDVNLNGVASVKYGENVKALERRLTALVQLDDDPTDEPGEPVDGTAGGGVDLVQLTRSRRR